MFFGGADSYWWRSILVLGEVHPKDMSPEIILELLIDEKLTEKSQINEANKSITPKTKAILLTKDSLNSKINANSSDL